MTKIVSFSKRSLRLVLEKKIMLIASEEYIESNVILIEINKFLEEETVIDALK